MQRPSRDLRIAFVTNRFYPEVGGAETNIFFQARELAKVAEVTVFCPRRLEETPGRETLDGIKVVRMWDVRNPLSKFPNISAATLCPSLLFHLAAGGFDVIHCFPAVNPNNLVAALAAKIRKIPTVLVSFDFLDYATLIRETGRYGNFLEEYQISSRMKRMVRWFDHIFTISDRETHFLRDYHPSVSYSPVPVEIGEYETESDDPRSKYGLSPEDFLVLMLGRVSEIKGQDIGLEAFVKARKQMPGAKLVCVGRTDFEPEFFAKLEAVVADEGIADEVVFTDVVERDEVLGWLRHADLHLIPVRFMNSGAVVVESWASDTPVIHSDAVDPTLVTDGENGFVFPTGSSDGAAASLRLAFAQKTKLPAMGKAGSKVARGHYTYRQLTALYLDRYARLLGDIEPTEEHLFTAPEYLAHDFGGEGTE